MFKGQSSFLVVTLSLIVGLVLAANGCGEERTVPATQLIVSVNSDLDLRTQLSRIDVVLYDWQGLDPQPVETRPFSVTADEPLEGQTRLPFSFGIVRGKADRFRLIARGYAPTRDGQSRLVVQQTLIVSFQEQQTLLLKVFLGSACYDKLCPKSDVVEATCYPEAEGNFAPGECGPIPELTMLEPLAPGEDPHAWTRVDAGLDAALPHDASADAQPDADAHMDAAPDAAPDATPDAAPEAAIPDAAPEASMPTPRTLRASIASDADDVTWVTEDNNAGVMVTTERFRYRDDASGSHIEVGNDEVDETIGLRFALAIPKGATVSSAKLTLHNFPLVNPNFPNVAPESATMKVQVFDSAQTPVFAADHTHLPAEHAPLWPTAINGFRVGAPDQDTQSPELAVLVQHILDRPEWASGASVVFLLSVDTIATGFYADFTDYTSDPAQAARLDLVYTAPE